MFLLRQPEKKATFLWSQIKVNRAFLASGKQQPGAISGSTFDISGHLCRVFQGSMHFFVFLSVENIRFWLFQSLLTPSKVRFPRETWMRNQTLIKGPLWATTNSCWCRGFQNSLGMICTLLTSKSVDSPHTKSNYSIERMCLYPLVNQQKTMENHNL